MTLQMIPAASAVARPGAASGGDDAAANHTPQRDGAPGDLPAEDSEAVPAPAEPIKITFAWPELHNAAQSLWPQLAIQLVSHFGDSPEPPQFGRYVPPRGTDLNIYLRLLEQLLAINCAMSSRNAPLLVTGERDTLRALLDLALRYPASLPVRLMLGELLLRVRSLHPEVLAEFIPALRLFSERHPFPDQEAATLLAAQQAAALNVNASPQPVT